MQHAFKHVERPGGSHEGVGRKKNGFDRLWIMTFTLENYSRIVKLRSQSPCLCRLRCSHLKVRPLHCQKQRPASPLVCDTLRPSYIKLWPVRSQITTGWFPCLWQITTLAVEITTRALSNYDPSVAVVMAKRPLEKLVLPSKSCIAGLPAITGEDSRPENQTNCIYPSIVGIGWGAVAFHWACWSCQEGWWKSKCCEHGCVFNVREFSPAVSDLVLPPLFWCLWLRSLAGVGTEHLLKPIYKGKELKELQFLWFQTTPQETARCERWSHRTVRFVFRFLQQ